MASPKQRLTSKLNSMAHTKKRKRRRRHTTALSAPSRRRTHRRRTTRRRGLSAPGSSSKKMDIVGSGFNTIKGALGGGLYLAPQAAFKIPTWGKLLYGLVGGATLHLMKAPNVGSGFAGAMTYDVGKSMLGTVLKDGEFTDVEYVDPSTLSDTGLQDENGNAVVMDDDGIVYALQDDGVYEAIGTQEDLEDAYSLQDNMQSVSMTPLSDPYSLSNQGNYLLQ